MTGRARAAKKEMKSGNKLESHQVAREDDTVQLQKAHQPGASFGSGSLVEHPEAAESHEHEKGYSQESGKVKE